MSIEQSSQGYSGEKLSDQRTRLIREKQQAEEKLRELTEKCGRSKK